MKASILLVGHGSREKKGNLEIEEFVRNWQQKHPKWHIEVCFIEFAEVLLNEGLDRVAKHSKHVFVVPLILNAAAHVKMEIPEYIAEAKKRHPLVLFKYAKHLGINMAMLGIVKRRLFALMREMAMPDPKTTGVIILGRGSSDKVANGEIAKLARWLWEETDHELVDIAFTGITYPRIETAVQRQILLGMSQVVIQPYYLFNGVLIHRIQEQFNHLQQQYPHIRFILGTYFGFEDEIYQLLDTNIAALLNPDEQGMMECDGCDYRKISQEYGRGHEH